jgi:methionyl-tRNA formyltransferase
MNIVLVGEETAGIQTLRGLAQSGHRIVAVMSSAPEAETGSASVWKTARELELETWPSKLVKDASLADTLRTKHVDIILNVHSLYIVHEAVLQATRVGAFNLHPGPLPRYAGLNAVSWAIYRGETTHGVTIHKMVPEIDAGPIVYQSLFDIGNDESALSLASKCTREGVSLMRRLLETAGESPDSIPLIPQNLSQREYFGPEVPEDGWLRWSWRASQIVNFVRACDYFPFSSPWGHPRAKLRDREIGILKARRSFMPCNAPPGTVGTSRSSGTYVAAADEWVLVDRIKIGNNCLRPADLLKPGDCLCEAHEQRLPKQPQVLNMPALMQ